MLLTAERADYNINIIQSALHMITSLHIASYKYPEQACVFDNQAFDYIVVGGGTAGCVLANRLADDNKTTVLLIEAGGDPQIETDLPALMLYAKSNTSSWRYMIEDFGVARKTRKPTDDDMSLGKVLGGSSSLSYLTYSPGSKHDYNDWAKIVNDSIWKWENVLPYLKKSQRLMDSHLKKTDNEFYGENGNIGLSVIRSAGNISAEPYFKAFAEAGEKIVPSVNGNLSLGYSSAIFTISNNIRQSTALSYLVPQKNNSNLYVLKNAIVKKILFDNCKNAIGVEVYVRTGHCKKLYIRARNEVILSAGVVNSPKILLLSGIGPKKHLCNHKIHLISDIPVGQGLRDHLGVALIANMTKLIVPERPFNPQTFPAAVIIGYVALNKSHDYPDYQAINYVNFPNFQMNYCTHIYTFINRICNNFLETSVNSQTIFSIINKQTFKSRGQVMLRSNDFRDDPIIDTGYYSHEDDLDNHAEIVRDFVKVAKTETFKKLGGIFKDPNLPACGKYNGDSLEYWKCYVRYMMVSQHQYSSTCAMGEVVDSRLRVYGVQYLRVVDASVMPYPTAGGTLGSTIMIAEKAADLIKEDRKKRKICSCKDKHIEL